MVEFRVEWQDAPGVTAPHLAATWARLEMRCAGRPLTQFWTHRSNSVRPAVYSSVFPLARWIVRSWWHLLYEGLPTPGLANGVRGARSRTHGDWMRRHGLFLSREGMAYPDLTIFRLGDAVAVTWVADPEQLGQGGRFVSAGFELVPRDAVVDAFTKLLETIFDRLDAGGGDEVEELRDEWEVLRKADSDEAKLCVRLAMLGMDPYAPDSDERFEKALVDLELPEGMLRDLLDACSPQNLLLNASAAEKLASRLPATPANGQRVLEAPVDPRPYVSGYARARRLRQALNVPATEVPALDLLLAPLGATALWHDVDDTSVLVDGVLQLSGQPAMSATDRSERAKRFLIARAIHHWYFVRSDSSNRRVLSRSNDWEQAASRAFAAELLAPAAALEARLRNATWDSEDELAEEFQVSRRVIAHQVENHGLA